MSTFLPGLDALRQQGAPSSARAEPPASTDDPVARMVARAARPAPAPRATAAVAVPSEDSPALADEGLPLGARLLNIADTWLGMHCHFPDEHARHAAVLWAAAQHFRAAEDPRRLLWGKFARPFWVGEPNCGKSTGMILTGFLCGPWFFGLDNNPTAPGLCATISQEGAVVAIDEFHRVVGPKGTANRAVTAILCAGWDRYGTYLNARGGKATRVPVFGAAMIGGRRNPLLTSCAEEIDDLLDRAIVFEMEKPPEGTELLPIMEDGSTQARGGRIGGMIAEWAAQEVAGGRFAGAIEAAREAADEIGLSTRGKEIWVPQITVGVLASEGHMRAACDAALAMRLHQSGASVSPAAQEDAVDDLEADVLQGAAATWS